MDDHRAAEDMPVRAMATTPSIGSIRVVFSVLYNETEAFLEILVKNFLGYTGPESFLVVNLPPGRPIATPACAQSDRVLVFAGGIKRHKFGHTLLAGHIEAFDHASTALGRFDFFCPLASNSLFGRRFDLPAAMAKLSATRQAANIDLDHLPDTWWWDYIKRTPPLVSFMRERGGLRTARANQIEGLFASHDDWALLHAALPQILELGALVEADATPALEEVLPATFFINFGSGRYINICYLLWRADPAGQVGVDDLLGMPQTYPAHVCALKWFERSTQDIAALAVSQDWSRSLIASLGESLATGSARDLLMQRRVLEDIVTALRRQEKPMRPEPGDAAFQQLRFGQRLTTSRQQVALSERRTPSGEPAAYLSMEDTRHELRLDVRVEQTEDRRISISSDRVLAPDEAAMPDAVLEGYLYLNPLFALDGRVVRLSVPLPATADQERAARHIVMRSGRQHTRMAPWHVSDADGMRSYYFEPVSASQDEAWVGIPVFGQQHF